MDRPDKASPDISELQARVITNERVMKRIIAGLYVLVILLLIPVTLIALGQRVNLLPQAANLSICATNNPCVGIVNKYTSKTGAAQYVLALDEGGYYLLKVHPSVSPGTISFENFVNKKVKVSGQATDDRAGGGQGGQTLSGTIYVKEITLANAGGAPTPPPSGSSPTPTVPVSSDPSDALPWSYSTATSFPVEIANGVKIDSITPGSGTIRTAILAFGQGLAGGLMGGMGSNVDINLQFIDSDTGLRVADATTKASTIGSNYFYVSYLVPTVAQVGKTYKIRVQYMWLGTGTLGPEQLKRITLPATFTVMAGPEVDKYLSYDLKLYPEGYDIGSGVAPKVTLATGANKNFTAIGKCWYKKIYASVADIPACATQASPFMPARMGVELAWYTCTPCPVSTMTLESIGSNGSFNPKTVACTSNTSCTGNSKFTATTSGQGAATVSMVGADQNTYKADPVKIIVQ